MATSTTAALNFQYKATSYLSSFLVLLFVCSCNSSSSDNTSNSDSTETSKMAAVANRDSISAQLYYLYLENYLDTPSTGHHNQLDSLREYMRGNSRKLVFTFFHDSSSEMLTLAAWVGKRSSAARQYYPKFEILHIDTVTSGTSLKGKNVLLGNLEITDTGRGKNLNLLFHDSVVNKKKYKYIIFKPKIDSENRLTYELYSDSVRKNSLKAPVPLPAEFNPSPPKDAY